MRAPERRRAQTTRERRIRTAAWTALLLLLSPTAAHAAGGMEVTPNGGDLVLDGDAADNDGVIDPSGSSLGRPAAIGAETPEVSRGPMDRRQPSCLGRGEG